ncbi:unnamed protein product [Dibothriocephalus latus]|uniref:Uncharacterized protein n=1 Tax=Dibothriocephalus latus TaxID=60516 RepID=A0A3P6PM85_DIBLA|nr:unnamed protein product [Dibothriocephalus latus]
MPSRTLLITLLVLASVIFLSRVHPKGQKEVELKETKNMLVEEDYNDLLESALAESDIPEDVETPAEINNEESITFLRTAEPEWWRRFRERVRSTAKRVKMSVRRAWEDGKLFTPLIVHTVLRIPVA